MLQNSSCHANVAREMRISSSVISRLWNRHMRTGYARDSVQRKNLHICQLRVTGDYTGMLSRISCSTFCQSTWQCMHLSRWHWKAHCPRCAIFSCSREVLGPFHSPKVTRLFTDPKRLKKSGGGGWCEGDGCEGSTLSGSSKPVCSVDWQCQLVSAVL